MDEVREEIQNNTDKKMGRDAAVVTEEAAVIDEAALADAADVTDEAAPADDAVQTDAPEPAASEAKAESDPEDEPGLSETESDEGDEPEEESERCSRRWLAIVGAFAAGFAACIAAFAILIYGADLGRVIPKADLDYYEDLSSKYGKHYVIMNMIDEDPLVKDAPEGITDEDFKELIGSLGDPYAQYFTKKEYEDFTKPFNGGYVGVGIVVEQNAEGLFAVQIFEGGPAEKAGMESGDQIIRIDGTEPSNIDDAVDRMMGEDGTEVTVTVKRDGKEIDLKMKRAEINMPSVDSYALEDNPEIGYINLTVFSDDSDDEFKEAVKSLKKDGCSKFILDLRNNGGGLTDVSIDIADYLLPECRIMTEISKNGKEKEYRSDAESADLDMVVLVNENTASASEILTAAIKENDAGTVIGGTTYGKGVTQISRQFKDGSAVKMTVTEYLTPDGNHVQDKGIAPDIEASEENMMATAIEELNK